MAAKGTVIYYQAPEIPLTPDEISHELANFSKRDRIWQALMQMLQVRLANAVIASTDDKLSEREAGIAAGRILEITELQQDFAQYRESGVGARKQGAQ